eukprot:4030282-Prymnesium_polylepis.1
MLHDPRAGGAAPPVTRCTASGDARRRPRVTLEPSLGTRGNEPVHSTTSSVLCWACDYDSRYAVSNNLACPHTQGHNSQHTRPARSHHISAVPAHMSHRPELHTAGYGSSTHDNGVHSCSRLPRWRCVQSATPPSYQASVVAGHGLTARLHRDQVRLHHPPRSRAPARCQGILRQRIVGQADQLQQWHCTPAQRLPHRAAACGPGAFWGYQKWKVVKPLRILKCEQLFSGGRNACEGKNRDLN